VLLELFEQAGRNVQRTTMVLRDMLAGFPESSGLARGAVASLFEHGIDPMIVIRWKDIFESLEAAVDACETVANVLEGISLKR
jgi:hypothetical protein